MEKPTIDIPEWAYAQVPMWSQWVRPADNVRFDIVAVENLGKWNEKAGVRTWYAEYTHLRFSKATSLMRKIKRENWRLISLYGARPIEKKQLFSL